MRNCPLLVCRALLICAPLVALLHPGQSHAQPAPRTQGTHRDTPAGAERVQQVNFDDDLLNADLGTPYGAQVFGAHLPPVHTLLIRPRTHFLPELYKSVEHL